MKIVYLLVPLLCYCQDGVYNQLKQPNESMFQVTGYPLTGDIPLLNRKIFRGTRVNIREHPYIVSIRRKSCHYLTGTLITKNLVLTVAHPIYGVPVQELRVVAGENYSGRGTSLLTVLVVLLHRNFDPFTLVGDLAMIRIYEDIIFKSSIKSISLVGPKMPLAGRSGFIIGWGRCDLMGKELCLPRSSEFYPDEKMDPMLRAVPITVTTPNDYCDGYALHETKVQTGMLCAGSAREENPSQACLAVPGAPLVLGAKLAGIQSWGFGCGYQHDLPLVYTSIQHYTMWIAHNIMVFRKISGDDLTKLFQATKSLVVLNWLLSTRISKPVLHKHSSESLDLQILTIDMELSKLQGNLYDIRDFVYNDTLHTKKILMYQKIQKNSKMDKTPNKIVLTHNKTSPFFSNKSLLDISSKYEDYSSEDDYD